MKQILLTAAFIILFIPGAAFAQQGSPVLVVKKLFTLLDQSKSLINKEDKCYESMDGMDILKLNKTFIKEYLNYLKKTGLFSRAYLLEQEKYYQQMEIDIKKDGNATARDADLYTQSQDPPTNKEILAVLQKTVPLISGNNAVVTINLKRSYNYKLIYKLVKENNSWVINSFNPIF